MDYIRFFDVEYHSTTAYVMSFLVIPILYLLFIPTKMMIIKLLFYPEPNDAEFEALEVSKSSMNKMIVSFINRCLEAFVFVLILVALGFLNFYYDFLYKKVFPMDDDYTTIGFIVTIIFIITKDFLKMGFNWYMKNSNN